MKITQNFNNTNLISVVMPTLNSANTITNSLFSLLSQSCQNWELVIVDGYSIDGTIEIVKKLIPNAFIIFREPIGIWDAVNAGINASRGEYIFFLNSDDTISYNALYKLQERLITSKTQLGFLPFYSFAGFNYRINKLKGILGIAYLYGGHSASLMIKKELLLDYNLFDESFKGYADYDLFHRLKKDGIEGQFLFPSDSYGHFVAGGLTSVIDYRIVIKEEYKIRHRYIFNNLNDLMFCFIIFPIKFVYSFLKSSNS